MLSQPWFHGNINRKEASQKLSRHGTVSNVHVVVRLGDSLKKAVQDYSICLSVLYVFEKATREIVTTYGHICVPTLKLISI